jgi:hypothetical protein
MQLEKRLGGHPVMKRFLVDQRLMRIRGPGVEQPGHEEPDVRGILREVRKVAVRPYQEFFPGFGHCRGPVGFIHEAQQGCRHFKFVQRPPDPPPGELGR